MPPVTQEPERQESWDTVRSQTEQLEPANQLAAAVHQWDHAVRLFRQVEEERFIKNEPSQADKANHQALLTLLINLGRTHLLTASTYSDQQLAQVGLRRANLESYVRDLEDDFFLWYVPDFEPDKTAQLKQAILGAQD